MRTRASLIFRCGLIIAVVAVVSRTVDWGSLIAKIDTNYLIGIFLSLPLILTNVALQAWRHALFLSKPLPPFSRVFKAFLVSALLNNVLPARSGELVKASYLYSQCGVPISVGLVAVAVERLLDVIMLAVLTIASMAVLTLPAWVLWICLPLIPISVLSIAFVLPRIHVLERWLALRLERRGWTMIASAVLPMLRHLGTHISGRLLVKAAGLTCLSWCLSALSFVTFIEIAAGGILSPASYLTLFTFTVIGIAIPILPGGLLTFEGAAILVLTANGYQPGAAIMLAIGLRLAVWTAILPISMVILMLDGTGVSELIKKLRANRLASTRQDQLL